MDRMLSRAERLKQLEGLLYRARLGLTVPEMAARLGVHRSTVYRDLNSLIATGTPIWEQEGRFGLNRERYLGTVRLDLHEALALYLAARLLSGHWDKRNPHAVSAMQKLASVMPEPMAEQVLRTAEAADRRREVPGYVLTLGTLARAWAEQRQVRMTYRAPGTERESERVFDPYFIEPSPSGYACYVIGHDHLRGDIRNFKVERIVRLVLLETTFEVRAGFNPHAYLANAWGVMGGETVTEVLLRFSKDVAYRIRESDWPGEVSVAYAGDGTCAMTLRVNHAREMVPWIRGWGPDCEVIAPEDLRRQIAGDMKKAAEVYGRG
jgi:proteasome accessory factor B